MNLALNIQGQENVSWQEWLALARACERERIRTLYTSDHHTSVRLGAGGLEPWATIAALAAVTERVRLGTLVSPVTFRPPTVMAKLATTADRISGGRIDVGLGIGWFEAEHRAGGFPFPSAPARLELLGEQLRTLTALWAGEEVTTTAGPYRISGARQAPLPVQRPRPRLIIGGTGRPGTLRLAARWADEYNASYATVEEAAARSAKWTAACSAAGRPGLALSVLRLACLGETAAEREERLDRWRQALAPRQRRDEFLAAFGARALIGDIPTAAAEAARYTRAGVTSLVLGIQPDDLRAVKLAGELGDMINAMRV